MKKKIEIKVETRALPYFIIYSGDRSLPGIVFFSAAGGKQLKLRGEKCYHTILPRESWRAAAAYTEGSGRQTIYIP